MHLQTVAEVLMLLEKMVWRSIFISNICVLLLCFACCLTELLSDFLPGCSFNFQA